MSGISEFSVTYFLPVKFRTIARKIQGSNETELSLDGKSEQEIFVPQSITYIIPLLLRLMAPALP
jgi:hypothetical protein